MARTTTLPEHAQAIEHLPDHLPAVQVTLPETAAAAIAAAADHIASHVPDWFPLASAQIATAQDHPPTFINWGPVSHFDPHTPLDPLATHGIPLPTYGNYGGPNYTAGVVGGTTPEPSQLNDTNSPVDLLDWQFYWHDLAYQHSTDPTARVTADLALVFGMQALPDPGDPGYNPEVSLYDGFATLGIIGQLAGHLVVQFLPEDVQEHLAEASQEALVNFEAGLAALPEEGRSLNGAFHVIEAQHPDWFLV